MKKKYLIMGMLIIIILPIMVGLIVSLPGTVCRENDWIGFWGGYAGGIITLVGVFLSIIYYKEQDEKKNNENIRKAAFIFLNDMHDIYSSIRRIYNNYVWTMHLVTSKGGPKLDLFSNVINDRIYINENWDQDLFLLKEKLSIAEIQDLRLINRKCKLVNDYIERADEDDLELIISEAETIAIFNEAYAKAFKDFFVEVNRMVRVILKGEEQLDFYRDQINNKFKAYENFETVSNEDLLNEKTKALIGKLDNIVSK